jgi:hypothetical protein
VTHHANHANAESTRSTLRGIIGALRPKACSASTSLSGGGATVRQGGDSPNGSFPGPSSCGVFSGPQAGAAATLAAPRFVVASHGPWSACPRGAARTVHPTSEAFPPSGLGRPRLLPSSLDGGSGVRRLALPSSRPTVPASGLAPGGAELREPNPHGPVGSFVSSAACRPDASPSAQRPADRHARDSAPVQGLGQMGGQDPESAMIRNRNLSHPVPVALSGGRLPGSESFARGTGARSEAAEEKAPARQGLRAIVSLGGPSEKGREGVT